MAIDTIGGVLSSSVNVQGAQSNISETAFIQLFLSQLQFQDPLKPLSNTQFLTQLSQFASVEQETQAALGIQDLLLVDSGGDALALLGHQVDVLGTGQTTAVIGTVEAIQYDSSGNAQLTVSTSAGNVITGVQLSQVNLVKP